MTGKKLTRAAVCGVDALIPDAVLAADLGVPVEYRQTPPSKWPDNIKDGWNKKYHSSMDAMAKKEGLRY